MIKYKLVKIYPGCSVKIGTEVFRNGNYYQTYFATMNVDHFHEPLSVVENYPEFWEEVIQKDYEILTVNPSINHSGYTDKETIITWQVCNKDFNFWNINSIKRLSDGAIFTVGDDVLSKTCSVPNKILSIQIINNEIRLYPRNSFYKLNEITKVKQLLFTTNDGVEVFIGDNFYYIGDAFNICLTKCLCKGEGDFTKFNTFATEIVAKKFIKENEKKYSLNDMTKIANHWAFIKGQPNNDNTLKIIEKWEK